MYDPRFADYPSRAKNFEAFYGAVTALTPEKTTDEWLELCERTEVPAMPVVDVADLADDEHLQSVGMFERHEHPTEGGTVLVRPPVKFSKSPGGISWSFSITRVRWGWSTMRSPCTRR